MVTENRHLAAGLLYAPWLKRIGIWVLLIVACVIGAFLFKHYLRVAATILLLAAMLTFLLQPVVEWLVRVSRVKHLHQARIGATLLLYLTLAGGIYLVGASVVATIGHNIHDLQTTWTRVHTVPAPVIRMQHWYLAHVPRKIQAEIALSVHRELNQLSEKYVPTLVASVMGWAQKAGHLLALLIELIFVPLVAFYFLTDAAKVRESALFFVPRQHRAGVMRYSSEFARIMRQYVHSQLILCLIAWAVVTVALLLMGIPGAILLGIIAGLSRAIPVIGPLVGGVPVLGFVLFDPHWAGAFWWVLVGFCALHFIESKFIMPRILGEHLGVHPVLVIVSLLVGYEMLGLLGMFLAPPAVAMIQFILAIRRSEEPPSSAAQLALPGMTPSVSSN